MVEVVAHVVAHERQHRKGVAPHRAGGAGHGGGRLAAHGGGHVDALDPVAGFGHQRHGGRAAAAEDERVDRHAGRAVPLGVEGRIVGGGHREARRSGRPDRGGRARDERRPGQTSPGSHKIQGIGAGFVPAVLNRSVLDAVRTVSEAEAFGATVRLAREEGLFAGVSSGANVAVALKVARELGAGKTVVTVLCDTGERYLSLELGGAK